jgi:hypothetical protein
MTWRPAWPPLLLTGDLMPTYSFRNNETLEEFDQSMSNSDRELFLVENPHIQQIFKAFPGVVDSVRIGVRRPDDNFRDVLKKAKIHKHNTINDF